jgi:glycosyltransferase involved in cell wall biosynthesis
VRIVVCHSAHERCGIRQYGQQLDRSLSVLAEVSACDYPSLEAAVQEAKAGDVFLFHYEPQLPGDWSRFSRCLATLRAMGCKTVFTCHWYTEWVPYEYGQHVDLFVRHRYYEGDTFGRRVVEIPLACPVYEPKATRAELRAKLGLPALGEAIVLTTVGFLTSWKRTPEAVETLLAHLPETPRSFVHVQAPYPFDVASSGAPNDEAMLRHTMERFPGRVRLSTEFLPEGDLLDLVHASDLGFVFHGKDTGSVSAATKQFVSARTPVVVTNSTHASDIIQGARRVGGFDTGEFAREVVRIALDAEERERLREGISKEYQRINMDAVAKRYV